jgi:MFS family permease
MEMTKQHMMFAWMLWGLASGFYFLEYLARVAPGVMVPELMSAFSTTAFGLGSFAAFFYYGYVLMQLPVGILVDRWDPRFFLIIATSIAAIFYIVFACTSQLVIAQFARFFLGIVSAFGFITSLKIISLWFPANKRGVLVGITQSMGMFGAILGIAPVSLLVTFVGWRFSIGIIAFIFFLLSLSIFLIKPIGFRSAPVVVSHSPLSEPIKSMIRHVLFNLLNVVKRPQTLLLALYTGLLYAPLVAFGEFWGTNFLHTVYGLTTHTAALGNSLIFVGWAIGAFSIGWLSDYLECRKVLMILSAVLNIIFVFLILYVPHFHSLFWLFTLLFFLGLSNTGSSLSFNVIMEIHPRESAGTAIAFLNMSMVLFGTFLQIAIGFLLDFFWSSHLMHHIKTYSALDFRYAMSGLLVFLILAAIIACFIRETFARHVEQ